MERRVNVLERQHQGTGQRQSPKTPPLSSLTNSGAESPLEGLELQIQQLEERTPISEFTTGRSVASVDGEQQKADSAPAPIISHEIVRHPSESAVPRGQAEGLLVQV